MDVRQTEGDGGRGLVRAAIRRAVTLNFKTPEPGIHKHWAFKCPGFLTKPEVVVVGLCHLSDSYNTRPFFILMERALFKNYIITTSADIIISSLVAVDHVTLTKTYYLAIDLTEPKILTLLGKILLKLITVQTKTNFMYTTHPFPASPIRSKKPIHLWIPSNRTLSPSHTQPYPTHRHKNF